MINGRFVFGLDDDDIDVFKRTVEWGVENAMITATYLNSISWHSTVSGYASR